MWGLVFMISRHVDTRADNWREKVLMHLAIILEEYHITARPSFQKKWVSPHFQRFKYQKNCADSTVILVFETLKILISKWVKFHFL